jgi:hypothetical protein
VRLLVLCFLQYEAIPESLKNMLLVMDSAGVFSSSCGYSQLWTISWDRINTFLPTLKEELFRSHPAGSTIQIWIFYKVVVVVGPPLWSSGESSLLQIQRSRVRFPAIPDFWEAVGLEQGPFSLVSATEELLGRNISGSSLEIREHGRGDLLHWPRATLYPQKLALTSPTSGFHLV